MATSNLKISFSHKRNRALFYRDVFNVLDNPSCYRLLIDPDTKNLAVEVCKLGDPGYHIAPDFSEYSSNRSYELCSIELMNLLWGLCGWDTEKTYRVSGFKCPDIPVIIFELDKAEIVNEPGVD